MTKTFSLNLAEITGRDLIRELKRQNANIEEMLGIMECFFEMFSSALHFSQVLQAYAEQQYPEFMLQFAQNGTIHHDIKPQALMEALARLDQSFSMRVH